MLGSGVVHGLHANPSASSACHCSRGASLDHRLQKLMDLTLTSEIPLVFCRLYRYYIHMLTRFAPRVCICQVVLAGCRTDFDDLKKRRLSIISESSFFISTSFCDSYATFSKVMTQVH